MSLSASFKKILNDFALSQPGLKDSALPYPSSQLKLGDVMDGLSTALDSVTYDFAVFGGTIGTIALPLAFPKNSIITRIWTDPLTDLASAGAATVALEVGSQVLRAAAAYTVYNTNPVEHPASLPIKISTSGKLEWVIAGADLTAGKVKVYVEWIKPL